MKGIYFIAAERGAMLDSLAVKAKEFLEKQGKKVGIFTPIGREEDSLLSLEKAKDMAARGNKNKIIEAVIEGYKEMEKACDFVVIKGTPFESLNELIEFRLNYVLADNLCLPVAFVFKEEDKETEALSLYFLTKMYADRSIECLGSVSQKTLESVLTFALDLKEKKITPKMFEYNLIAKAKAHPQRIVLPEGTCERVLKAANEISYRKIAEPILLGNKDEIVSKIKNLDLSFLRDVEIIEPNFSAKKEEYAQKLFELREKKGMTKEKALESVLDENMFGTLMIYSGDADGMVSGAEHTTADTIRPALQVVKTKEGVRLVSGAFLMCFKGTLKVFCDCAVNPNPTSENLVDIARGAADTALAFGIDPKIGFISYSTGDSGKGPDVDVVKEAVALFKEKYPEMKADGPMQFDAALVPKVASLKMPKSDVAGQVNVLIFPDLNTGNTVYKAVQRASDESLAVGPILQGLKKPVNDLSRGCTIPDIINTVAVTAVSAQFDKGLI